MPILDAGPLAAGTVTHVLPFEFRNLGAELTSRAIRALLGLLGAVPFILAASGRGLTTTGRIVVLAIGGVTFPVLLWLGTRIGSTAVTVHSDRLVVRNFARSTTIPLTELRSVVEERVEPTIPHPLARPRMQLAAMAPHRVPISATAHFLDTDESELDPLLQALEVAQRGHDFTLWRSSPKGTPRPSSLPASHRRRHRRPPSRQG